MNDRLRQKEKLFHPHKVVIALPEECKGYMDATKEQMRNWWNVSRFHHMKLNKKVLCKQDFNSYLLISILFTLSTYL